MALNRPTGSELLEALREFLDTTVAPQVDAATRFNLRIAANVIGIVQRELEQKSSADASERTALQQLMPDVATGADLETLNRGLVTRIRDGQFDDAAALAKLLRHLRTTTAAKLAIDNPRYE